MATVYFLTFAVFGLAAKGLAQLRDPPRLFNRLTSFNCIVYSHAFHCASDNSCIPPERVRDGTADCADGSDEQSSVNICDYAPYFPDYRCSAYSDCINQPDGYACRCRNGYVGPGELCQPAPLNFPQFVTTPRPLVIQTFRNNGAVTEKSAEFQGNSTGNSGKPAEIADEPRKVTSREFRSVTGNETSQASVTATEGILISSNFSCPPRTLMVKNETGTVWCLKFSAHGNLDYSDVVWPAEKTQGSLPPNFIPTVRMKTNASTGAGTGRSDWKITFSTTKPAERTRLVVITTRKGQDAGVTDAEDPRAENRVDIAGFPVGQGTTGITEDGAMYGYMPTSSTSRRPGLINLNSSVTLWASGSIITPVKIWNATGGALTAYRITPSRNASLPVSCLVGSSRMFLCAVKDHCIPPEKILDGVDDCSDGSDEVPEFIDECSFGTDWPSYRCDSDSSCTDTEKGYICRCATDKFWNGTSCTTVPGDLKLLSQAVMDTINEMRSVQGLIMPEAKVSHANVTAADLPVAVNYLVYPGGYTESALPQDSNLLQQQLQPVTQTGSLAQQYRIPPETCIDCIPPELVTLGPVISSGTGQEARDPNRSVSRQMFNGSRLLPAMLQNEDKGRNVSSARYPPGITITGVYNPPENDSSKTDPDDGSDAVGTTENPEDAASTTEPNQWAAVLAALGRQGGTTTQRPPNNSTRNIRWQTLLGVLQRNTSQSAAGANAVAASETVNTATGKVNSSHISGPSATLSPLDLTIESEYTEMPPSPASSRDETLIGTRPPEGSENQNSPRTSTSAAGSAQASIWPLVLNGNRRSENLIAAQGNSTRNGSRIIPGIIAIPTMNVTVILPFSNSTTLFTTLPTGTTRGNETTTTASPGTDTTTGASVLIIHQPSRAPAREPVASTEAHEENATTEPDEETETTTSAGRIAAVVIPFVTSAPRTTTPQPTGSVTERGSTGNFSPVSSRPGVATTRPGITGTSSHDGQAESGGELMHNELRNETDVRESRTSNATLGLLATGAENSGRTATIRFPLGSSTPIPGVSTGGLSQNMSVTGPVYSNLADLRRNATNLFPAGNNTNATSARPGTSNASLRPTLRSDENATSGANIGAVSIVLTTFPSAATTPRANAITSSVSSGLINPSMYPTGIFFSSPSSNPAQSANNNGVPLDRSYDCFADLFRRGYSALQQNVKTCDQGCDLNSTERCIQPPGRCDCVAGTTRSSPKGQCHASVQFSVGLTMDELCGKPLAFQPYMSDLSSSATQQLGVVICYQIEQLIKKSSLANQYSPGSCNPRGYTPGSVVSNIGLSFTPAPGQDPSFVATELTRILGALLNRSSGAIGDERAGLHVRPFLDSPNSAPYFPASVADVNECASVLPPCGSNSDCRNDLGSFSCQCRPGYVGTNSAFPNRDCVNATLLLLPSNFTIVACPPENYIFGSLCLYKAYYILLIIAIIIACIIVLLLLICLIICCCRGCGRKRQEFTVPQVALMRAAQRSPREPLPSAPGANYQQLKSEAGPSLDPNVARPPPAAEKPPPPAANYDLERGEKAPILPNSRQEEEVLQERVAKTTSASNDVDTWEEVEVPTFVAKEDEKLSMRALSPSQGSMRSRTRILEEKEPLEFLESAPEEKLEEVVTETVVQDQEDEPPKEPSLQRSEPHEPDALAEGGPPERSTSTNPETESVRASLPPSPSASVKRLAEAKQANKRYHLEAQGGIPRKASAEAREWLAIPRTESLVMEDDGMDVDTLPDTSYHKDPIYTLNSPVAGMETRFDEKDLRRLGMGFRDSFDDVMEQTSRFYKESSSDIEFDREVDLSRLKDTEAQTSLDTKPNDRDDDSSDEEEGNGKDTVLRQPAYLLEQRATFSSAELPDENEASETEGKRSGTKDEDLHSLRSTEEDELQNLGGSQTSLKSLRKHTDGDVHDDVIDRIVEDVPVFYSGPGSSDEEYLTRKSQLKHQIAVGTSEQGLRAQSPPRKTSSLQREIAINEFGAMGERDSIDDVLDRTEAFFSRTSTMDSFQLPKRDSTDDSQPSSRKPSQSASQTHLAVDGTPSVERSPRQRTLLKKRSAFHSRDSMNRIMETSSAAEESVGGSTETLRGTSTTPSQSRNQEELTETVMRTEVVDIPPQESRKEPLRKSLAIDEDDIADFFATDNNNEEAITETVIRTSDKVPEQEEPPRKRSGEFINETVTVTSPTESPKNSTEIRNYAYDQHVRSRRPSEALFENQNGSREILEESVVQEKLQRSEPRLESQNPSRAGSPVGSARTGDSPRDSTEIRNMAYADHMLKEREPSEPVDQDVNDNQNREKLSEKVLWQEVEDAEKEKKLADGEQLSETVVRSFLAANDSDDMQPNTSRQDEEIPTPSPVLRRELSVDNKSVKSISEQNLLQQKAKKSNSDFAYFHAETNSGEPGSDAQGPSPPVIHDSDSGVYVDNGHTEVRRQNIMASQDDLRVFEGQEARREGSGSSYQRMSQSDDEEEVVKRYSAAYKSKVKKTVKKVRHNYEMGPPESRHVYYSSRPKRMPPNAEELDIWKDSTRWRARKV